MWKEITSYNLEIPSHQELKLPKIILLLRISALLVEKDVGAISDGAHWNIIVSNKGGGKMVCFESRKLSAETLASALKWMWVLQSLERAYSQVSLLLLSHVSRVRICATPWTAAHQAPLSMGFSRQEHWSGLPFPSPTHESEKWKRSRSVRPSGTPWTAAYQAPPPMGFSSQEYWSGLPLPSCWIK